MISQKLFFEIQMSVISQEKTKRSLLLQFVLLTDLQWCLKCTRIEIYYSSIVSISRSFQRHGTIGFFQIFVFEFRNIWIHYVVLHKKKYVCLKFDKLKHDYFRYQNFFSCVLFFTFLPFQKVQKKDYHIVFYLVTPC